MFDVPCQGCGKNVFTVPYVADVQHVLTCQSCKAEIWVLVDKDGGISYFEKSVALEEIKRALRGSVPTSVYPEYYFKHVGYKVIKSELAINYQMMEQATQKPVSGINIIPINVNWTTA